MIEQAGDALTRRGIALLLIAGLIVAAPLALYLPLWVGATFVGCAAWRMMCALGRWRPPSAPLRLLMVTGGLAAVVAGQGTILGRDAGVSLLALMVSFKLLELNTRRDAYVMVVLNYFLILTLFLFTQSIYTALYMGAAMLAVTAALNSLNVETGVRPLGAHLRFAATVGLQALPLMVVLFVLFPRFGGPLWSIQRPGSATTGLSSDMAPGRISQLTKSDAVAFRVKFSGAVPPQTKLYWRGPVLWHTDGERWTAGSGADAVDAGTLRLVPHGDPVSYTVTLEPSDERWLLALDLPASVPRIGHLTPDYQLHADHRVTRRIHYNVVSYTDYATVDLTPAERRRALQLPAGVNPQATSLAQRWRRRFHSDAEIVDAALHYFHDRPFVYTMSPPPLRGDDPVDDFLFDTRRGFCEHYSSSFTWLMRAAGIPARVVTGYQGGEVNPLGHYLIVRQSDAHAWSEVWLRGQGWTRVDPTAAVAPERIELGFDPVPQPDGAPVLFQGGRLHALERLWRAMGYGWDALNFNWDQWVLGYSRLKQIRLFSSVGLHLQTWGELAAGMLVALGLLLSGVAAVMGYRQRGREDRAVRLYRRFCSKLARRGIQRAPHEGPAAFAARVERTRPDIARQVHAISTMYMDLRYTDHASRAELRSLSVSVRTFRP